MVYGFCDVVLIEFWYRFVVCDWDVWGIVGEVLCFKFRVKVCGGKSVGVWYLIGGLWLWYGVLFDVFVCKEGERRGWYEENVVCVCIDFW